MNSKPQRVFCLQYSLFSIRTIFSHFLFALFRLLAGEKKTSYLDFNFGKHSPSGHKYFICFVCCICTKVKMTLLSHIFSLSHTVLEILVHFFHPYLYCDFKFLFQSTYLKCLLCLVYVCNELKLQLGVICVLALTEFFCLAESRA